MSILSKKANKNTALTRITLQAHDGVLGKDLVILPAFISPGESCQTRAMAG